MARGLIRHTLKLVWELRNCVRGIFFRVQQCRIEIRKCSAQFFLVDLMHRREYWTYWSDGGVSAAEYGLWAGDAAPALGTHFHDEGQLTLVLSGSRKFELHGEVMHVKAGQCLYVPAGVPHRSLPHVAAGTQCLNIYYTPEHAQQSPALMQIAAVLATQQGATQVARSVACPETLRHSLSSIADIAASSGLSREAYSRKFTRDVGMSPHAYRIVARLNAARRQLRDGAAVAETAADCGFADQSHFGRHFFRAFGVTPAAYRNRMR